MTYKNGRPLVLGEVALACEDWNTTEAIGVIVEATPVPGDGEVQLQIFAVRAYGQTAWVVRTELPMRCKTADCLVRFDDYPDRKYIA